MLDHDTNTTQSIASRRASIVFDDPWSDWWLHDRFGGDEDARRRERLLLEPIRDRVLDGAKLRSGNVVLDVGTGDGLIGFGALERVAARGQVVFSDIRPGLLRECERIAAERGVTARCHFEEADANDLSPIADEAVDVVTGRSVLCSVADKRAAFASFVRVLRPGGRVSLFEVIHARAKLLERHTFFGYPASAVHELGDRVRQVFVNAHSEISSKRASDEMDLLVWAEQAGLAEITVELRLQYSTGTDPPTLVRIWDAFLASRPLPYAPSFGEAISQALDAHEVFQFKTHLRPLVESGRGARRLEAWAYLTASKAA